jgi:hypothetical protein
LLFTVVNPHYPDSTPTDTNLKNLDIAVFIFLIKKLRPIFSSNQTVPDQLNKGLSIKQKLIRCKLLVVTEFIDKINRGILLLLLFVLFVIKCS